MADIKFCYADVSTFRDWIAGQNFSSTWTTDTSVIRRILESVSRRMDAYVGGSPPNTFGPTTQTRVYDLGKGSYLRDDPRNVGPLMTIQPEDTVINVIPLGGWLVSATSVTVYEDTARTASATWTEGTSGDYFMGPYNVMGQPYYFLKVNEDTSKSLYAGQKTLAVAGTWGWQDTGDTVTTTSGTWTDSATSLDVTSAADISEGSTIKVGTEQLYVTSISSNTLTVQRGVHGTTAASATGGTDVLKITFNPLVTQTCLDLAHIVYRDRDLGFNDRDENPTEVDTRTALHNLDTFATHSQSSGVLF